MNNFVMILDFINVGLAAVNVGFAIHLRRWDALGGWVIAISYIVRILALEVK